MLSLHPRAAPPYSGGALASPSRKTGAAECQKIVLFQDVPTIFSGARRQPLQLRGLHRETNVDFSEHRIETRIGGQLGGRT